MNGHLRAGQECIRLIREFETGPRDGSVRLTGEGAALDAYWCGAAWTVGFGCTRYVDGTRVQQGDTITESEVYPILTANLRTAEWAVKDCVEVKLSQHQFDALTAFCFNLGKAPLQLSTRLLPAINSGRFEDAASEFSAFVYSTTSYKGKPYQRALRGLLRRRLCEACTFLGYDWVEAVQDDRVALPTEREWQESKGRYRDRILTEGKTTFAQVFRTASMHRLPEPDDDLFFEANEYVPRGGTDEWHDEVEAITNPVRVSPDPATREDMPPAPSPAVREPPSPAPSPAAAPDTKVSVPAAIQAAPAPVGTKPLSPNTLPVEKVPYGLDPKAGTKPIEESERGQGFWYQQLGSAVIRIGAVGGLGTAFQGMSKAVLGDPVLFTIVVGAITAGGIAATGFVVKAFGDWRRRNGERDAVQALR